MATSWGVAVGLLAAMIVIGHVMAGRLSSSMAFMTVTVFFLGGSLVGFLHGGLLGYAGRPPEVSRRLALKRLGLAVLYAVPAMAGGWLVALLVKLSVTAFLIGQVAAMAIASLGWVVAAVVLWWAVVETRGAFRNLCDRWPGARVVTVVLGLAFLALLPLFLLARPEIWIIGVRPSSTAAALMALAATLWITGPLAVLALLVHRAWVRRHPTPARSREAVHGGGS